MKRRLITSALPYVNNVPHLGNLIQVLSADAFARFCRARGYETCYVCGTDEYGTATETRAAEEGVSPRELCGRYWEVHNGIYRWFNIQFDQFGRTSTPIQTEIVQELFKKLDAAGYITEKTVEQSYCPQCERFLADRYIRGVCPHCGSGAARGDQCEACGKLLDPTELKEARCASCGGAPEVRSTKHLYIDLPKIRPALEQWLDTAEVEGRWAKNAVQMTRAWIRDGLHERAITRDLKWGIPVPKAGYENKVFYVWFDAPAGYISITGSLAQERGEDWRGFVEHWWRSPKEVELFQFIGKDNIPFHTVIFPSSQLGSGGGWTMLHHMSSSEYLNYESGKFSKSQGVGVFGTDVMETGIAPDIWRFYIYYNRPEKADTLFTWKDFAEKVNGELIGNLGNLVNRTLSFVRRYFDSEIPQIADIVNSGGAPSFGVRTGEDVLAESSHGVAPEIVNNGGEVLAPSPLAPAAPALRSGASSATPLSGESPATPPPLPPNDGLTGSIKPPAAVRSAAGAAFWETVRSYEGRITEKLEWAELRDAYRLIFELSSFANKAFQDGEPWRTRTEDPPAAAALIGNLCYLVRDLAILIAPFTPEGARKIASFFGADKIWAWEALGAPSGLLRVEQCETLWTRLDDKLVAQLRDRYAGTQEERKEAAGGASKAAPDKPEPPASGDPSLLDLRVARIAGVERHPNADKLYVLKLDLGGEERVIVSGLVGFYREEELLGKHIIVAYNLKAAKLRGVMSKGMLLAASCTGADGAEALEVLDAGTAPPGARVTIAGASGAPPAEITIDAFFSVPIRVSAGLVNTGGSALLLEGAPLCASRVPDGEVG